MKSDLQPVPLRTKIYFALGQFGWSLTSYAVSNLLSYFYVPPKGTEDFPQFISNERIGGVATWLGMIALISVFFDVFSNIWVAGASDRSRSPLGKRKFYMMIGILPFSICSFLMFMPLKGEISMLNVFWIMLIQILYYIAMAVYVSPYTALVSDLGHKEKDRLFLSTIISVTWAAGFAFGTQVYVIKSLLLPYFSNLHAFQLTLAIFAFVGFCFMLLPIFFIDEKKYCDYQHNDSGTLSSLRSIFRDKDFVYFIFSDFVYWIAANTINVCLVYYVVNLLSADEVWTSAITIGILIMSFVAYIPLNRMSSRIGKSKIQKIAYFMQALSFGIIFCLGWVPVPKAIMLILLALVISFPLAAFGILPNAILSDIIAWKKRKDNEHMAAIYFSVKTAFMKVGIHLSNMILLALIPIGQNASNIGIRMTALVSVIASAIGLLLFMGYDENKILGE